MQAVSKYVEILFRHRLRFLILLVVLPAELAFACIFLFPHQTAASSLWVDTPTFINVPGATIGWNTYLTPAQNTVDSLNQLRSTDSFVSALGVKLDAKTTFRDADERDSVLGSVTSDMAVTAPGSHLVVITYTCPHEPICTNVLSATEDLYRESVTAQQSAQINVAIKFYTEQLAESQDKLNSDQKALTDYLSAHPGLTLADAALYPPFDKLVKAVQSDQAQVAAFQAKLDNVKLSAAALTELNKTVLQVVDKPHVVGGRFSALPKKQMVVAGVAALAIGFAVLVLMAWSDRSSREPSELENILKLPVVVTIPDLRLMEALDG